MLQLAQGWYYLLSERVGKRKHLHVNIYKNNNSSGGSGGVGGVVGSGGGGSDHASDGSKPTSNDSANYSNTQSTDNAQSAPSSDNPYASTSDNPHSTSDQRRSPIESAFETLTVRRHLFSVKSFATLNKSTSRMTLN